MAQRTILNEKEIRMKLLATAILCAASLSAFAQPKGGWTKEPTTVFGIQLGAPLPNERISECGGVKVETEKSPIGVCAMHRPGYGGISIAGFPVAVFDGGHVGRSDADDVVTSILLTGHHSDYRSIKSLLIERYGKPTLSTTERLQNGMGAAFSSEVLSWTGRRVSLVLRERSGTINQTSAFFSHNDWLEKKGAERDKAIKAGASKM